MTQQSHFYFVKDKQIIRGPYSVPQLVKMLKKKMLFPQSPVSCDKRHWESLQELLKRLNIDISYLQFATDHPQTEKRSFQAAPQFSAEAKSPRPPQTEFPGNRAAAAALPVAPESLPLWERVLRMIWDPAAEQGDLRGEEKLAVWYALLYAVAAAVLISGIKGAAEHSWNVFFSCAWHRAGSIALGALAALLAAWVLSLFSGARREFCRDMLAFFMPLVTFLLTFAALWQGCPAALDFETCLATGTLLIVFTFFAVAAGIFLRRRFPEARSGVLLSCCTVYFMFAASAVHYGYMMLFKEF